MNLISVDDELPTSEDYGQIFLCVSKIYTHFSEYQLCEWFNPLREGSINEFDDDVLKPHFICEGIITHWIRIPELPIN